MQPLLIIVDGPGYLQPIIDRLEYEKFPGEIVRTFTESDAIDVMKNAGFNRTCIIVTDSLVPSKHATDTDRAAGTQEMIKQARELNPHCKIIVNSSDFFELDKKFTKEEVDFIDACKSESFHLICEKIHGYAKAA